MAGSRVHGELVHTLSQADQQRFRQPRGGTPKAGTTALWRLDGLWYVWSEGPEVGTWWLQAQDDEAFEIVDSLASKLSLGEPVVRRLWKNCIAVKSNEIKPGSLA